MHPACGLLRQSPGNCPGGRCYRTYNTDTDVLAEVTPCLWTLDQCGPKEPHWGTEDSPVNTSALGSALSMDGIGRDSGAMGRDKSSCTSTQPPREGT